MTQGRIQPLQAAQEILKQRYLEAHCLFLAGSVVRGQGTPHSDLDLVVVFPRLANARRESFLYKGWPVEAFVHDPATLRYFFDEVDGKRGFPSLPQMVLEGLEIPGPSPLSAQLKDMARNLLQAGPPALTRADLDKHRYFVSDLMEDLREPRNPAEARGAGVRLYEALADYYFRSHGFWSARGKAIPRHFAKTDPATGAAFEKAFEALFGAQDSKPVIVLCEKLLAEHGGPLFEGYDLEAPAEWRKG